MYPKNFITFLRHGDFKKVIWPPWLKSTNGIAGKILIKGLKFFLIGTNFFIMSLLFEFLIRVLKMKIAIPIVVYLLKLA